MDAKQIGQRLIKLRGDRTRQEVCSALNLNPSALANYENGYRIPCDEVKIRLANYYHVTIDELFYCP